MTISKEDLQARFKRELAEAAPLDWRKFDEAARNHVLYGLQNYSALDDGARGLIDKLKTLLLDDATAATLAMEDGPRKRERLRLLADMKGEHFSVKRVYETLGQRPSDLEEYVSVTESAVLEILQDVGDVMHDVRSLSPRGRETFVISAVLAGAIDDELAAILLLRRGLVGQVATLLRAAQEKIELVELFLKKPRYIEVWTDKKRSGSLKPGKVRGQLGRQKDVPYIYLSEAGAHPTFMSLKMRTVLRLEDGDDDKITTIQIWVGGQRLPWAMLPLCVGAIGLAALMLATACKWMSQRLDAPEHQERLILAAQRLDSFKRNHAIPMFVEMGMLEKDAAELLEKETGLPPSL